MKTVTVQFDVKVPADVSDDDLEEWLNFNLHATGGMRNDNPLADRDLEAEFCSVRVR